MTTLLLVRHAETDWNRAGRLQGHIDTRLNSRGHAQAQALARTLARTPLRAVYSSDLTRARETATAVAAPHRLPVQLDPQLRERHHGSAQARVGSAPATSSDADGETDDQLTERAVSAARRIAAAHPHARVLVVSHGDLLRALWHATTGQPLETWANCGIAELTLPAGSAGPASGTWAAAPVRQRSCRS